MLKVNSVYPCVPCVVHINRKREIDKEKEIVAVSELDEETCRETVNVEAYLMVNNRWNSFVNFVKMCELN